MLTNTSLSTGVPQNHAFFDGIYEFFTKFNNFRFHFRSVFTNLHCIMEKTDEQLMEQYRDGNARAFDLLYERHKGGIYRYLLRQCNNAATAEELFQDVWMNLVRSHQRYTVQAKFTTYLYRMAHNRLIDYYRKSSRGLPVSFEDAACPDLEVIADPSTPDPSQVLELQEQGEILRSHMKHLPEAQLEAFLLREESGLRLEEIAEITGVNVETAKSRLRYAVTKLKSAMRGYL